MNLETYNDIIKGAASYIRESAQRLLDSTFSTLTKEEQATVMNQMADALQATEQLFVLFQQEMAKISNRT
jgi:hypothetical protein